MSVIYTAEVRATGDGRNGAVRSTDGIIDFPVAAPKEMGGAGGATNPEQLFAAGFAACFHSALRIVARRQKANVDGSEVNATVGIGPNGSGAFGLTVGLQVTLPEVDRETAQEIIDAAEKVCPYSNAVRGNVEVTITLA